MPPDGCPFLTHILSKSSAICGLCLVPFATAAQHNVVCLRRTSPPATTLQQCPSAIPCRYFCPPHAGHALQDLPKVQALIHIRSCVPGEVRGVLGDVCDMCVGGQFSFDPTNATCDTSCPAHALCPGGPIVYPDLGWWHSNASSVIMHKCPIASSCGYILALTVCRPPPIAAHQLGMADTVVRCDAHIIATWHHSTTMVIDVVGVVLKCQALQTMSYEREFGIVR